MLLHYFDSPKFIYHLLNNQMVRQLTYRLCGIMADTVYYFCKRWHQHIGEWCLFNLVDLCIMPPRAIIEATNIGISHDRAIYPPCQCLWTYWVELHGALFQGPTNSTILRIFPCWLKFWHLHISEDMLIDLSWLPNPILLSSLLPSVFHIVNPLSVGYADKHILRAGELDMLTVDR